MPKRIINVSKWEDYRGKKEGILIYIHTSPKTELPIRDVLNELGKGYISEPNYETGTYGMVGCEESKTRTSILKNKRRYIFFGTIYLGTNANYKDKFLLTGYMRIDKTFDLRHKHVHTWMEHQVEGQTPECVNLKDCPAFYSSEMNFYKLEDCFELTVAVMQKWGYKGRVAKHMKLTFNEEFTSEILTHFASKTPANDTYAEMAEKMTEEQEAILSEVLEPEVQEDTEEW